MRALTSFAANVGAIALGSIWNGCALTIIWGWFVVPTFGAPGLAPTPAIGLAMVASYLTPPYMPKVTKDGDTWDQLLHAAGHAAMRPAMALAIGWIVKQWI